MSDTAAFILGFFILLSSCHLNNIDVKIEEKRGELMTAEYCTGLKTGEAIKKIFTTQEQK